MKSNGALFLPFMLFLSLTSPLSVGFAQTKAPRPATSKETVVFTVRSTTPRRR